ncbi:MAG: uncharacterized DUF497 family protein [Francisellaceae bacterium]|jgi:uncharacterized DUF497 family protein
MIFEWDEKKHQQNIKKHGISFHIAELMFNETLISTLDNRKNYGENRYIAFSIVNGRCINIVYTERGDSIRIISIRKANERETKTYTAKLKKY